VSRFLLAALSLNSSLLAVSEVPQSYIAGPAERYSDSGGEHYVCITGELSALPVLIAHIMSLGETDQALMASVKEVQDLLAQGYTMIPLRVVIKAFEDMEVIFDRLHQRCDDELLKKIDGLFRRCVLPLSSGELSRQGPAMRAPGDPVETNSIDTPVGGPSTILDIGPTLATAINIGSSTTVNTVTLGGTQSTVTAQNLDVVGDYTSTTGSLTLNSGSSTLLAKGNATFGTVGTNAVLVNGLLKIASTGSIQGNTGTLNIGTTSATTAINIGTGATAQTITIGGTGDTLAVGAGAMTVANDTQFSGMIKIASSKSFEAITSGGALNIATAGTTGSVNIGTSIAVGSTVTIGSTSRAMAINASTLAFGAASGASFTGPIRANGGISTTTLGLTIGTGSGLPIAGNITIQPADGTGGGGTGGSVIIQAGSGLGAGGSVTIDTGTGGTPAITIGAANAAIIGIATSTGAGAKAVNIATGGTGAITLSLANLSGGAVANNVTIASGVNTGATTVNIATGTADSAKTITIGDSTGAGGVATLHVYKGSLLLHEIGGGANSVGLQAQVGTANQTYQLPVAYPGSNGYALVSTTGGLMSWSSVQPAGNYYANGGNAGFGPTAILGTTDTAALTVQTGAVAGAPGIITVQPGNNTTPAGGTGAQVTVRGGTGTGTDVTGGAVTVAGGTALGTGTGGLLTLKGGDAVAGGTNGSVGIDTGSGGTIGTPVITIGGTNANAVHIGRSGQLTEVFGNFQVDGTTTTIGPVGSASTITLGQNAGDSITAIAGTVDLATNTGAGAKAVNIATGGTGAITLSLANLSGGAVANNVTIASGVNTGATTVNIATGTADSAKTITIGDSTGAGGVATLHVYKGSLLLHEIGGGANSVGLQAQVGTANQTYQLPVAYPGSNGYALVSTTGGLMSWSSVQPAGNYYANGGNAGFGPTAILGTTDTAALTVQTGAIAGAPGIITVQPGNNTTPAGGTGAQVTVRGGTGTGTDVTGGAVTVAGGTALGTGTGGLLTLKGGDAVAGGTNGSVSIDTGSGGTIGTPVITIGGTNASPINIGQATGTPTHFVGTGAGGDQTTSNAPNAYLDATTGQLMRSTSTVLANAYVQGGNSFAAPGILGINDALAGAGYGLTIQTASGFTTAGNVVIQPGNGTTTGGSVVIDTGTGGAPKVTIGGTNASIVDLGRSGQMTDVKGNFQVDGDTVNLSNGANTNAKVVNIATSGTGAPGSSAVTVGSPNTVSTIKLGQNTGDAVFVAGTLYANGWIESQAGAVNIATVPAAGTLAVNIATAPALNQFVTVGNTTNHLNISVADANFLGSTVVTCQGRLNAEGSQAVGGIEATNTGVLNIGTALTGGGAAITPMINIGTANAAKTITIGSTTDTVALNANNLTVTTPGSCTFVNAISANGGIKASSGVLNIGTDTVTNTINIGGSPSTAQTVTIGSSGAGATTIQVGGFGDKVGIGGPVSAGTQVLKVTGDTWMTGNLRVDDTITLATSNKPLVLTGNGANTISVQAPTGMSGSWTMALPISAGTNGYVLLTDGLGNTSWSNASASGAYIQGGNAFGAPGVLGITDSVGGLGVTGYGLTIQTVSGNTTAGNITIQPGNGVSAGGSVIIDTGTGGAPTVAIGGANASMVNLGRSGQLTDVKGNLTVDGNAVNLATGTNTSAKVVNIATNGAGAPGTSTVTVGSPNTVSTIKLGQNTGDAVSVAGTLYANGWIESQAGAVNIATVPAAGTLAVNVATAPGLNQYVTIGNNTNHLNISVADANFLGSTVVTCQGRLNAEGSQAVGGIEATNTGVLNIGTALTGGGAAITPMINIGTANAAKTITIGSTTDTVALNANNLTVTTPGSCTFVNAISANGGIKASSGVLNIGTDSVTNTVNIGGSPSTAQVVTVGASGAGTTTILLGAFGDKVGVGGPVSAGTQVLKVTGDTLMTGNLRVDDTITLATSNKPLVLTGNGANTISVQAPTGMSGSWTMALPISAGTSGGVLATDGLGSTSWAPVGTLGGYIQGGNAFGAPGVLGIIDSIGGLGATGYGLTIMTASGFTSAGNITIQPGNGLVTGGSVAIDTGTGGSLAVTIGGTNATSVDLGRSGQTTGVKGNFQVDGNTVNLASSVNTVAKVVNIATGGSGLPGSSAVTIGSLTTASTVKLGQNVGDAVSVRGILYTNGAVESQTGAVNIASLTAAGTTAVNIATAPTLNQFVSIGNGVNHVNVSAADANFLGSIVVTCQGRLNAEGTSLVGGIEATNTGALNIGTALNGLVPVTSTIRIGTANALKSITIGNSTDNVALNANNLTVTAPTSCTFVSPVSASGGIISSTGTLNIGTDTGTSTINIGGSPSTPQTVNIGSSGLGATSILIAGVGDKAGIGGTVSAGTEVLKVTGDTWMTGNLQVDGTETVAQNSLSMTGGVVTPVTPVGTFFNPAGGVRISHGSVTGGVLTGQSLDVASAVSGGVGLWTITLNAAYPSTPVVLVTPNLVPGGGVATVQVFGVTPLTFQVQTYVGGVATAIDFNFMIIGFN